MPTIRLTPTACTSSPGWYDLRYVGNTSGLRQVVFTIPNNETLGGAGVNITGITFHGYVRNSASAVKRLRIGCKPSASVGPNEWSVWDGQAVLDSVFTAADASGNGKYRYFNVSRTVSGTALERIAGYMQAKFQQGDDLCVGVIQPDGSKSIQINTDLDYWTVDVVYELLGNVPSANVGSVALKGSVKTTIQKVVSGSSTTLRYKIGSTTLATYSLGTGTSHTYTVPESAGGYFKTTATAQLTIEAETFVGGVSYGTVSTSVTITLPSDATPTATCTPSRTWVSGVSSAGKIAAYVQGKSGVNFALSGSGKYGATISSYELVIENRTYTTGGNSISHSPISGSGTVSYKYTVRDSRGLSRTYSASLTVVAWKKPSITTFEVERVTEGNAIAVDGTCVRATVKASVSSLNVGGDEKNSLKYYVRYRKTGTETWTSCDTETLSATSVNKSVQLEKNGAIVDTFDDMTGYEFQVTVTDLYDSSQASNALATKEVWWDVDYRNGAMGFGGEVPRKQFILKIVGSSTMACASGAYAYVTSLEGALLLKDFTIRAEGFTQIPRDSDISQRVNGTMFSDINSSGLPCIWIFSNKSSLSAMNAWLEDNPITLEYDGAEPGYKFHGPVEAEGIRGVNIYNAGEEATGGTWIDGKPVYRFSQKYSRSLAAGANTDIALGIGAVGTLLRMDVYLHSAEDGAWRPASYPNGDTRVIYSHLLVDADSAPKLRIIVGELMGGGTFDVVCILEYTKA